MKINNKDVESVQVTMKPSPIQSKILAVKLSVYKKNGEKSFDDLGLVVVDGDLLTNPKTKDLPLTKLKCKDTHIMDFQWH